MTALYTFRMIGMAFFGKKSKYLEEMEHRGHHLHEVGANMWIPFAILAVATIAIGEISLDPIAVAASFGAFAIGAILGYIFYIARKADPEIISRNIVTRAIWKFLYNRWYLNTALYWGGVVGPLAIYRFIWRYFESTIIDGMNPALQHSMTYMSRVVKGGQTGITQTYLFVFAVGIMIIVMLLML